MTLLLLFAGARPAAIYPAFPGRVRMVDVAVSLSLLALIGVRLPTLASVLALTPSTIGDAQVGIPILADVEVKVSTLALLEVEP